MWHFLFTFFLTIVFPQVCIICKKSHEHLCKQCQNKIKQSPIWQREQEIHFFSLYEYNQIIHRKLIRLWKYKGDLKVLSYLMDNVMLPEKFYSVDYIIPIPLHKQKQCLRGYNQAMQIAQIVQVVVNKPIKKDLLRIKQTKSQATLSREQRLKNLDNSFIWKGESLVGKKILLVDDVISTGSTVKACSDIVQKAGAESIIAFSLARGGK